MEHQHCFFRGAESLGRPANGSVEPRNAEDSEEYEPPDSVHQDEQEDASLLLQRRVAVNDFCAWLHAVRLLWLPAKSAEIAGQAFAYTPAAGATTWSLTLPQVAAAIAATLVVFDTLN